MAGRRGGRMSVARRVDRVAVGPGQIVADEYPADASRACLDRYRRAEVEIVIAVARYCESGSHAAASVHTEPPRPPGVRSRAARPRPSRAAKGSQPTPWSRCTRGDAIAGGGTPGALRAAALNAAARADLVYIFGAGEERGRA